MAGLDGRHWLVDRTGTKPKPYVLETFYYAERNKSAETLPYYADYIVDSGAFSFMSGTAKGANWAEYVDRYADWIIEHDVKKFFELDLDSIMEFSQVMSLRKRLERRTGRQPIPVWHKSRGKEQFLSDVKDYNYIAIGGIVTREITSAEHAHFPWFIDKAHENGALIHGLGYTSLTGLKKYRFDSVDSTTWVAGNRYGVIYKFNGRSITQIRPPKGKQLKDPVLTARVNFEEWCKFQRYAETHF